MTRGWPRPALAALAVLFFAAHVPFLPESPEDVDSINFALGVRDFDVARHQPHPPGYPVYIALAKATVPLFGGAGDRDAVLIALALWGIVAGAALIPLAFLLFRGLGAADRRAWLAAVLTAACPLFWFTALRPLSDVPGLAVAVAAQALSLSALAGPAGRRAEVRLIAAAALAGIAAGIRAQTVMLTAPLLVVALIAARTSMRARALAALVAAGACLLWAVPLLAANGGLSGYLAALGTQAGEDFSGVVMLWTSRTPRVAAAALVNTLLWPWGTIVLGVIVLSIAAAGALRLALRERRCLALLVLAFAPYAAFHLLFHETVTIRYALPLVLPTALLAAAALDLAGIRAGAAATAVLAGVLLAHVVPATAAYGSRAAPAARALRDAQGGPDGALPLAAHAAFHRTVEWELRQDGGSAEDGRLLTLGVPHGREWLALVDRWKADPSGPVAFVADPARTDVALFDPQTRELRGSYRWPFAERPYVGGVRPRSADRYLMRPPGWMLDRGWALSAEIGGVTAREGAGPHVRPSVAWIRARPEAVLMLLGGRNLGGGVARMTVTHAGRMLDTWEADAGFFVRTLPLPAGTFSGEGYAPLAISASGAGAAASVALEQFDLQPEGVPMFGYGPGWQEPEYNPALSTAWRWAAERSVLWIRPIGRDVTLTLSGESPTRYFDAAPQVRLSAAGQEIARFSPSEDFTYEAIVPAGLLERAGGEVVIESDRWFVPAAAGAADQRHLALRIYRVAVR